MSDISGAMKKDMAELNARAEHAARRTEELISIDDLKPYERNARTHGDKQVEMIAKSIRQFGFNNPILIDESNGIIAGHGRYEAAKLLKLQEVPCLRLTHLSDAQKRAYILADNRLAEKSGWDRDMLRMELTDISADLDVDLTGFSMKDMALDTNTQQQLGDGLEYKIIVDCENEEAQAKMIEILEAQGFSVRPLIS